MTEYVATRWYRAPEIMLSFQNYTKASKCFSLLPSHRWLYTNMLICWQLTCGRLVAFLLRCLVENPFSKAETVSQCIYTVMAMAHSHSCRCWSTQSNFGYSWYTWRRNFTACGQWKGKWEGRINVKRMICITHILVTQAQVYIRSLPHMPKILFQNLYPRGTLSLVYSLNSAANMPWLAVIANPLAIDLLNKLLEFDPAKRITVEEALAHPYLSAYHDVDDEVSIKKWYHCRVESYSWMNSLYTPRHLIFHLKWLIPSKICEVSVCCMR